MEALAGSADEASIFERSSARILLLSLLGVAVVSLWVFRPCLSNGFVNWDDQGYIEQLVRLKTFSWSSLRWIWTSLQPFYFQPIDWMTHLMDYRCWGLDPVGHHATNWFLHGLYVVSIGLLVWLLTGQAGVSRVRERMAFSALVALVCGIHPLQVESVAWISARNGLLCSFWMVLALIFYLRAVDDQQIRSRWWWATVAVQVVALLTKPFAVSLPLLFLVLDFFPLGRQRRRGWGPLFREKWMFFLLSALAALGAIASQEQLERLSGEPVSGRVLAACRGFVFYLWKLIWPAWLSPFYPLESAVELRKMEYGVPAAICLGMALAIFWLRKRLPILPAAAIAYVAILLPVSGLVQVGGQAVADRYAYLAMVPPLLVLASGGLQLWRISGIAVRGLISAAMILWLVFLGVQTRSQIPIWRDGVSLWSSVLRRFPTDPRANFNLAMAFVGLGDFSKALPYAERAVNSSDPNTPQLPVARATLGTIYLKTHDYAGATNQLQQALAANPNLPAARYNLACAHVRLGQLSQALEELRELIAAHPEYAVLARRDSELASLRQNPKLALQFADLVSPKTDESQR